MEMSCRGKIDEKIDSWNVAVARVLANGDWALARPCKNCQTCMKRKGVKRVYYTISPGEYGTMLL